MNPILHCLPRFAFAQIVAIILAVPIAGYLHACGSAPGRTCGCRERGARPIRGGVRAGRFAGNRGVAYLTLDCARRIRVRGKGRLAEAHTS